MSSRNRPEIPVNPTEDDLKAAAQELEEADTAYSAADDELDRLGKDVSAREQEVNTHERALAQEKTKADSSSTPDIETKQADEDDDAPVLLTPEERTAAAVVSHKTVAEAEAAVAQAEAAVDAAQAECDKERNVDQLNEALEAQKHLVLKTAELRVAAAELEVVNKKDDFPRNFHSAVEELTQATKALDKLKQEQAATVIARALRRKREAADVAARPAKADAALRIMRAVSPGRTMTPSQDRLAEINEFQNLDPINLSEDERRLFEDAVFHPDSVNELNSLLTDKQYQFLVGSRVLSQARAETLLSSPHASPALEIQAKKAEDLVAADINSTDSRGIPNLSWHQLGALSAAQLGLLELDTIATMNPAQLIKFAGNKDLGNKPRLKQSLLDRYRVLACQGQISKSEERRLRAKCRHLTTLGNKQFFDTLGRDASTFNQGDIAKMEDGYSLSPDQLRRIMKRIADPKGVADNALIEAVAKIDSRAMTPEQQQALVSNPAAARKLASSRQLLPPLAALLYEKVDFTENPGLKNILRTRQVAPANLTDKAINHAPSGEGYAPFITEYQLSEINSDAFAKMKPKTLQKLNSDQCSALEANTNHVIHKMTPAQLAGLAKNTGVFPARNSPDTPIKNACIKRFNTLLENGALSLVEAKELFKNKVFLSNTSPRSKKKLKVQQTDIKFVKGELESGHTDINPEHLSREQMSDITVDDMKECHLKKRAALEERAKSLANNDPSEKFEVKKKSILALFIEPKQIKQLTDHQVYEVLALWAKAWAAGHLLKDPRSAGTFVLRLRECDLEKNKGLSRLIGELPPVVFQPGERELLRKPVKDLEAGDLAITASDSKYLLSKQQLSGVMGRIIDPTDASSEALLAAVLSLESAKLTDGQKEALASNDEAIKKLIASKKLTPELAQVLFNHSNKFQEKLLMQQTDSDALTDGQVTKYGELLTESQLGKISHDRMSQLPPACLESLNSNQLLALQANGEHSTGLASMNADQISALMRNTSLFPKAGPDGASLKAIQMDCAQRFADHLTQKTIPVAEAKAAKNNETFRACFFPGASMEPWLRVQAADLKELEKDVTNPSFKARHLSKDQVSRMGVVHYEAAVNKSNLLAEAKTYIRGKDPKGEVLKDRLVTLALSENQIQALDDKQLVEVLGTWAEAKLELDGQQKMALVARLQSYQGPTDQVFSDLLKEFTTHNPSIKNDLVHHLKTPIELEASDLRDSKCQCALTDRQFTNFIQAVAEGDIKSAALTAFGSLGLTEKQVAILVPNTDAIQALVKSRCLSPDNAAAVLKQLTSKQAQSFPGLAVQATFIDELHVDQVNQTDAEGIPFLTREQLCYLQSQHLNAMKPETVATMTAAQLAGLSQNQCFQGNPGALFEPIVKRLDQLMQANSITQFDMLTIKDSHTFNNIQSERLKTAIQTQAKTTDEVKAGLAKAPTADFDPKSLSLEQIDGIQIQGYLDAHEKSKEPLLDRAEQLADGLTGKYTGKPDSLLVLYLKPEQIKELDKEQLSAVLEAWKEAGVDFKSEQEQLQALVDRHRQLNAGKAGIELRQAIGEHKGTITDPITPRQIAGLEAVDLQELITLDEEREIEPSQGQSEALFLRLRELNQTDLATKAAALLDDGSAVKNNFTVLGKAVDTLEKADIESTGPDGCCVLSATQITGVTKCKEDEKIAALNPDAMNKAQQQAFIAAVNDGPPTKLNDQQIGLLVKSKQLTPDAAADVNVMNSNNTWKALLDAQEQKDHTGDESIDFAALTKNQLSGLTTGSLDALSSRAIHRMNPAQLAGLVSNDNFSAEESNAKKDSDHTLASQHEAVRVRIGNLVKLGKLSEPEAVALEGKNDAKLQTATLIEVPSLLAAKVQEKLGKEPAFDVASLSRQQLAKIDWTQVHDSHKEALVARSEELARPAVLEDSLAPEGERVLDGSQQLTENSRLRQELDDAVFAVSGRSFKEFKDDKESSHLCKRLLQGPAAIRIARMCREAERANTEETPGSYQSTLRGILSGSTQKAFSDNPNATAFFGPDELAAFVDGDPKNRRSMSDDEKRKQLKTMFAQQFPAMLQQELLGIENAAGLVRTVDAAQQAAVPVSVAQFSEGKDKKLVNLVDLARTYKLDGEEGQEKLVERDKDEGHNLSTSDLAKESQSLLKAMEKNSALKDDAIKKAKAADSVDNFLIEDHLYQEANKKQQQQDTQASQQNSKLRDRLINEASQIRGNIRPPQGMSLVTGVSGDEDRPIHALIAWVNGMLSFAFGMGDIAEKDRKAGEKVRIAKGVQRIMTQMALGTTTSLEKEHLTKILACYKERNEMGIAHFHKGTQSYKDLEAFYCERLSVNGKMPKNRRDLWTVSNQFFGFMVRAPFKHISRAGEVFKLVSAERQQEKEEREESASRGNTRLTGVAQRKLTSLCHYLQDNPDYEVTGPDGSKEKLNDAVYRVMNDGSSTVRDLQGVLKKTGLEEPRIMQAYNVMRSLDAKTLLSTCLPGKSQAELAGILRGDDPYGLRSLQVNLEEGREEGNLLAEDFALGKMLSQMGDGSSNATTKDLLKAARQAQAALPMGRPSPKDEKRMECLTRVISRLEKVSSMQVQDLGFSTTKNRSRVEEEDSQDSKRATIRGIGG